jgi:hypothetical protein
VKIFCQTYSTGVEAEKKIQAEFPDPTKICPATQHCNSINKARLRKDRKSFEAVLFEKVFKIVGDPKAGNILIVLYL